MPGLLAAFVVGVCVLQWQAELLGPGPLLLVGLTGTVVIAVALRDTRLPPRSLWLLTCAGALLTGFSYAGIRAQLRMADTLPFAHEGRDVAVTGVVASLPVRLDRGVRFEFDVESHDADVAVPCRILLGWYAAGDPVQPGERWRFVVRLRRPHGALNPGGFDFEAWMLERGLRASGYVRVSQGSPPRQLESMVWAPSYGVERARAWLRDRLLQQVGVDRYGGVLVAAAAAVLRGIEVRQVLSSIPPRHAALGGREDVERCEAGDTRQSGTMALQVLHPPATDYERRVSTNAMSCVVRVQAGSVTVLLTGDIPADREVALAARTPALSAQLLVAPHHGSRSSSSPALLDAVAPSIVFAQAGYRNRYGHPHSVVVDRYATRGLTLARTDYGGALQWRMAVDGSVEHTAARAAAVRYWHNRPVAGQERPPTDTLDEDGADEARREPLSGMP